MSKFKIENGKTSESGFNIFINSSVIFNFQLSPFNLPRAIIKISKTSKKRLQFILIYDKIAPYENSHLLSAREFRGNAKFFYSCVAFSPLKRPCKED